MNEDIDGGARVKSAERVLDLIETVAAHREGISFPALLQSTGFPKSSLHQLLGVLTARRYFSFDERSRLYSLGVRVWENGQAFVKGRDIALHSREPMEAAAAKLNETVQLSCLDHSENVYLAKIDSTHPLRLQSEVGGRLSAHATGLGKAMLASLSDEEVRRRFNGKDLFRMTPNTLTTIDELVEELGNIRRTGFSVDNEEYTPGLFCIAVPIRDQFNQTVAAVSVSIPVFRISLDLAVAGLTELAAASVEITHRLGGAKDNPEVAHLKDPSAAREALLSRGDRWGWLAAAGTSGD